MQTILDNNTNLSIIERIGKLSENSDRLWGKMKCGEMICHCTDQIKMALGEIKCKTIMPALIGKIMFFLIMFGMPTPKGKIETTDELKQGKGGTKPSTFSNDINLLKNYVKNFDNLYAKNVKNSHPAFGKLSKKEWGKLIYAHLNHHLSQFGV
ncbi:MAG TPA: DUF1569 domain-containing protein [Melioribacteraceae bacterium]|nr:DUF1569 domain-containing protein [Melioribacteraceae bacterium]